MDVEPNRTQQGVVSALPITKHATTATRFAVVKALASCNQRQQGDSKLSQPLHHIFPVSTMAEKLIQHLLSLSKFALPTVQVRLRHFLTLGQTYQQLVPRLCKTSMNTLTTYCLQMSSLKLQTAPKCILLDSFPSHSTLNTRPIYQTDLHIFNGVNGIIMSWKACKALGILPPCYPQPPSQTQPNIKALPPQPHTTAQVDQRIPITRELMMQEFPRVFDGNIKTMEGEQFHIDNAKPFHVYLHATIPWHYVADSLRPLLSTKNDFV